MVSSELIFSKLKKAIETDNFEQYVDGMHGMFLQVGLSKDIVAQIIRVHPDSQARQKLFSEIYQPVQKGFSELREAWSEEIRLNVGDGQSKLYVGVTDAGEVCVSFNDPHHMNADLGSRFNALK